MLLKKNQNKTVLIALSGGVDSAGATLLLKEQGCNVAGLTYNLFPNNTPGALHSARKAALVMDVSHRISDISIPFRDTIIRYFIKEYENARTPDPCVKCNAEIKWKYLAHFAQATGKKYIASGHYAGVKHENGRFYISEAYDKTKDQSRFLWQIPQDILSKIIFPLSDVLKTEVKQMVSNAGLKFLNEKSESFNLCFLKKESYFDFLKRTKPASQGLIPGNVKNTHGNILGEHRGIAAYTIGQMFSEDLFVIDISANNREIIVGDKNLLSVNEVFFSDVVWQKYPEIRSTELLTGKIRYREQGTACRLYKKGVVFCAVFEDTIRKPSPGQSIVFYENNDIVCGGIIVSSR